MGATVALVGAAIAIPMATAGAAPAPATISGRVIAGGSGGTAVTTVDVEAFQLQTFSGFGGPFQAYGFVKDVNPQANGTYALSLPAGTYVVCFDGGPFGSYQPQCYDGQNNISLLPNPFGAVQLTGTPVTAGAGATLTGINGALDPSGPQPTISGRLTGAANQNDPIANATVYAIDRTEGVPVSSAVTAADGTYTLSAPASTTGYTICVDAHGASGLQPTGYQSRCLTASGEWDGLPKPIPTGAAFTLTGNRTLDGQLITGGRISGHVQVYTTNAAVSGATVYALDAGGFVYASTTSDASGAYALTGLPNQPVAVCVNGATAARGLSTKGFKSECYYGQAWSGSGAPARHTTALTVGQASTYANLTIHLPTAI